MTTDAEYTERVKSYKWKDVENLWRQVLGCKTPDWDAGKALEYLVLKGFQLGGADVRWPYSVDILGAPNVEQIDGIVYVDGISIMVECKDYSNPEGTKSNISFEPISKLRNQLSRRPNGLVGCLFASGGFTAPAQILMNFTKPETILCWTGADIDYCIKKKDFIGALRVKYQKCIERGIHDFDLQTLELLPV